eukprot:g2416.t1
MASTQSQPEPEWDDVLGSGALLRKRLTPIPSDDVLHPNIGQEVTLKIRGRLAEKPHTVFLQEESLTKRVGEGNFITGLDMAIRLMHEGEICQLKVGSRFGYGAKGNADLQIPPNADLEFEVSLLKYGKDRNPDLSACSIAERIEDAQDFYKKSKISFSSNDLGSAEKHSTRALEFLQGLLDNDEDQNASLQRRLSSEQHATVSDLRVRLCGNMALLLLKREKWNECMVACEGVLRIDPKNIKALYRKALIFEHRSEYSDAIDCLTKALELDDSSKSVKTALKRVKASRSKYKKNRKRMAKNMAQRHSVTTQKTSNKQENKKELATVGREEKSGQRSFYGYGGIVVALFVLLTAYFLNKSLL